MIRSKVVAGIREFFISKGFMEVETQCYKGFQAVRLLVHFITHHNALDVDMYLRIAPELYFKTFSGWWV